MQILVIVNEIIDMETETETGLLFILCGLLQLTPLVLGHSIDTNSIWFIAMGVGFLILGTIFIVQAQNAGPTFDQRILFRLMAVLMVAFGASVFFIH